MKKSRRNTAKNSLNGCPLSDKTGNLPNSYPGAKFARKCAQGTLGTNITSKSQQLKYSHNRLVRVDIPHNC